MAEVEELFVQPAAGDSGTGIGAALEVARRCGGLTLPGPPMPTAALGPAFDDGVIRAVLDACHLPYIEYAPAALARHLADGAVAGWFQGRLEAGPRALGQRSILADPRNVNVRDRINQTIKHREPWRPLAPVLLRSAAPDLLDSTADYPFMIVTRNGTDKAREHIPATVHIDGTLRPQTVPENSGNPHAALLAAFATQTGAPPALLNTSFNHEAEPIVCAPQGALRTFYASPWTYWPSAVSWSTRVITAEGRYVQWAGNPGHYVSPSDTTFQPAEQDVPTDDQHRHTHHRHRPAAPPARCRHHHRRRMRPASTTSWSRSTTTPT